MDIFRQVTILPLEFFNESPFHLSWLTISFGIAHFLSFIFLFSTELKKKVKHADRFSGLKLLRGFFFWLKVILRDLCIP